MPLPTPLTCLSPGALRSTPRGRGVKRSFLLCWGILQFVLSNLRLQYCRQPSPTYPTLPSSFLGFYRRALFFEHQTGILVQVAPQTCRATGKFFSKCQIPYLWSGLRSALWSFGQIKWPQDVNHAAQALTQRVHPPGAHQHCTASPPLSLAGVRTVQPAHPLSARLGPRLIGQSR